MNKSIFSLTIGMMTAIAAQGMPMHPALQAAESAVVQTAERQSRTSCEVVNASSLPPHAAGQSDYLVRVNCTAGSAAYRVAVTEIKRGNFSIYRAGAPIRVN